MPWYSILPSQLTAVETWAVRFFLFIGTLVMGPWIIFLLYDLALYIFRSIHHEVPVVGGRARGRQRPRAPSLAERPNGRVRGWSLGAHAHSSGADEEIDGDGVDGATRRRRGGRGRGHRKRRSGGSGSASGGGSGGSLTRSQELMRDGEGEDELGGEEGPIIVEED